MAGTTLLTLLDDIAALLDDVATLTKAATKQTAGVLGDDLALNAEQVIGVKVDRELPVVWAVFKGSAVNKAILVPAALVISAVAPWLITPLLVLGGTYLCFEGFEKIAHPFLDAKKKKVVKADAPAPPAENVVVDHVASEKEKIKGAVRTDLILSGEIIVISLGAVADAPFATRVLALSAIAALMTVGVYGLVAGIVKLDDAGLWLSKKKGGAKALGRALLLGAPYFMKALSTAGTAAMFLVGGGILVHAIPGAEAWSEHVEEAAAFPGGSVLIPNGINALVGLLAGALTLATVGGVKRTLARSVRAR